MSVDEPAGPRLTISEQRAWRAALLGATLVTLTALAWFRLGDEIPRILILPPPAGAIDLDLYHSLVRDWFADRPIYATRRGATHPPASYTLLWPLVGWLPLEPLRAAWVFITPIALAGAVAILAPVARLRTPWEGVLAGAFLVASYPVTVTLGNGQVAILELLALAAGFALLSRGAPSWRRDVVGAGLFLFVLAKPNVAAPFAWVILFAVGGPRPFVIAAAGYVAATVWAIAQQPLSLEALADAYFERTAPASGRWRRSANLQWVMSVIGLGRWGYVPSFVLLGLHGLWTWRHRDADPWLLVAVAALVARIWAFHGIYDDFLLFFPLVALLRLARDSRASVHEARALTALAVGTAMALLVPATILRSVESSGYALRVAQLALWCIVLVVLMRQGRRGPTDDRGVRWPAVRVSLPRTPLLLAFCALLLPVTARAQGYLRWDAGARAAGLAGAGAAAADDPAAVLYAPAGIVHLPGTHVRVEATAAIADAQFQAYGLSAFDGEPVATFDGAVYATHAIADRLVGGLGFSSPWGFATVWDNPVDFVGRFRAFESSLRSLHAGPVLAYGPVRGWSAAVGVDVLYARFDLDRFEQDPALSALGGAGPVALARTEIDTDGTGVGWNAGVHYRANDRFDLGAQIRSEIEVDFSGIALFTAVAPLELRQIRLPGAEETIGQQLAATYVDQSARTELEFPRLAVVGAAWRPVDQLRLLADLQWIGWGAVDTLGIAFADTNIGETVPLPYDDEWVVRLGSEVELWPAHVLRLGFAYQPSPASTGAVTPLFPDASRESYAIGFGFPWAGVQVDVGYRVSVADDREGLAFPANTGTADGVYETVEHRLGVGVARRF